MSSNRNEEDPAPYGHQGTVYQVRSNAVGPASYENGVFVPSEGVPAQIIELQEVRKPSKPPVKPYWVQQIAASGFQAADGLRAGLCMGYTATGIPSFMADPKRPFDLSIHERSIFASSMNLGGLFGCLVSGFFARTVGWYFGFNRTLIGLMVPVWFSWLLIAFPRTSAMMVTARVLQGFFGGIIISMASVYTSEVAHKSMRGFLLSTMMTWLSLGLLLSYALGSLVSWKRLAIYSGALPCVFLPLILLLPPSPVEMVKKGQDEEALAALVWLRGPNYDSQGELNDIKMHLREAEERHPSSREMLTMSYLKPIFLAAALLMLRQLTGYNQVVFFTVEIFSSAQSAIDAHQATVFVGVIILIFTFASALVVDHVGRKRLAVCSSGVMTVTHAILGTYFMFQDRAVGSGLAWLPLPLLVIFVAANGLGISHLQYLILGELLPVQIKTYATGFLLSLSALAQFGGLQAFEYMRQGMGDAWTFWFYMGCCAAIFIICVLFLPETMGRTLREIETDVTTETNDGPHQQGRTSHDGNKDSS